MRRASVRSVLENPQKEEYYYVLVTRYYPPLFRFHGLKLEASPIDVWDKKLAPSPKLIKWWKRGPREIGRWKIYEKRFRREVSKIVTNRLGLHKRQAKGKEVVLVCEEDDEQHPYCHTFILLEMHKTPPGPKKQWEVIVECPLHRKLVHLIVGAKNMKVAEESVLGTEVTCPYPEDTRTHTFKVAEVTSVITYPWEPKEVVTRPVVGIKPKVDAVTQPVRITKAERFRDNSVGVVLTRGKERINVIYPTPEIQIYDRLMHVAKATGKDTLKNGVLAHLIAHGSTSKTLATAFLNATDFKDATSSSVGEAISRLASEGTIIPHPGTIYIRRLYPLGFYGKLEWQTVASLMGEKLYHIHPDIRTEAKTRLKLKDTFAWYSKRFLKHPPVTPELLKRPVEYMWITIKKRTPSFRSAQDYKTYGPFSLGDLVKIPVANAYLLVRTNHARWLNPEKATAVKVEEAFQFVRIEKIRRQATL